MRETPRDESRGFTRTRPGRRVLAEINELQVSLVACSDTALPVPSSAGHKARPGAAVQQPGP